MGLECPHCKGTIDDAISRTSAEKRINDKNDQIAAKEAEIKLLNGKVTEASEKAKGYDTVKAQFEALQATHTKVIEGAARKEALRSAGIEERFLSDLEIIFTSRMAGKEGDELKSFADWTAWLITDEGRAAEPLAAGALPVKSVAAPGAPPAAKPPAAPAAPKLPNPLPDSSAGAGDPPPAQGKMTADQVAARLKELREGPQNDETKAERARIHSEYAPGR